MHLKSHDIVLLLKILSSPNNKYLTQTELSKITKINISMINYSFKRLIESNLIIRHMKNINLPILNNCREFIMFGIPYIYSGSEPLEPIHNCIKKSLEDFPDNSFKKLIENIDVLRTTRNKDMDKLHKSNEAMKVIDKILNLHKINRNYYEGIGEII